MAAVQNGEDDPRWDAFVTAVLALAAAQERRSRCDMLCGPMTGRSHIWSHPASSTFDNALRLVRGEGRLR